MGHSPAHYSNPLVDDATGDREKKRYEGTCRNSDPMVNLKFKATVMNTHDDIKHLQAREALEEVNGHTQIRTNRVKNQNLHCVHFGCQADGNHFLEKNVSSVV